MVSEYEGSDFELDEPEQPEKPQAPAPESRRGITKSRILKALGLTAILAAPPAMHATYTGMEVMGDAIEATGESLGMQAINSFREFDDKMDTFLAAYSKECFSGLLDFGNCIGDAAYLVSETGIGAVEDVIEYANTPDDAETLEDWMPDQTAYRMVMAMDSIVNEDHPDLLAEWQPVRESFDRAWDLYQKAVTMDKVAKGQLPATEAGKIMVDEADSFLKSLWNNWWDEMKKDYGSLLGTKDKPTE